MPRPRPHLGASSAAHPVARRWTQLTSHLGICDRVMRKALAVRMTPCEISESHFWLMCACLQAPTTGAAQSTLCDWLALSPAHVSASVEHLRRAGLLACHRSPVDRRKQLWQLTPDGVTTIDRLLVALDPWAGQLDERYGPRQRDQLFQALDQLIEIVHRRPAPAAGAVPALPAVPTNFPAAEGAGR